MYTGGGFFALKGGYYEKIFRQILLGGTCISMVLMFSSICKGAVYKYIELLPEGWTSSSASRINNNVQCWGSF